MAVIISYLIIVNLIALAIYGYDKQCAKTHKWRVSEKTLLAAAVIGGSVGAYIGMISFRHKTRHKVFQICVPLLVIVQILLLLILL